MNKIKHNIDLYNNIFGKFTDKDVMSGNVDGHSKCENYISVTDVKAMLSTPFDGDKVASGLVDKYYNDPTSKYYKLTKEQILESWSNKGAISMEYGRLLDECANQLLEVQDEDEWEMFLLDNNYDDDDRFKGNVDAMNSFISRLSKPSLNKNESDIEYIGREIPVCYEIQDEDCNNTGKYVKGRMDALFYNKELNKYIIVDWKSDEKIDTMPTRWTKNCLGAAKDFPQISWYLYSIQLYTYKMALLQTWLKDVDPSNIECFICNCPKTPYTDEHDETRNLTASVPYNLYKMAFDYDTSLLNKIYSFALKKKLLQLKKTH